MPRFAAYQLCRTFGTEGASAGLTGSELQALMGHEDLSTTQQYIRVTGRDLERAMARLKAWRDAKDSVTQEIKTLLRPAKPRPERLHRSWTKSGLQALSGFFRVVGHLPYHAPDLHGNPVPDISHAQLTGTLG